MQVDLISITPDAERLIEEAGRTCYQSHKRASEASSAGFVRMLVSRGHTSVLEHAKATFRIRGISRIASHQLVRHRLCSFSQMSQRYVLQEDVDAVVPPRISASEQARKIFDDILKASRQAYTELVKLGIAKEDARFVLPGALETEIVLTANFRELRHIIEIRGSRDAQWEVRKLATELLRIMKLHAPNVFADLTINEEGVVVRTDQDRQETKTEVRS